MALMACKCPHCGGDVNIDDSLTHGFCMYCGTKIINDNAMIGHITVDRTNEIKNALTLTKSLLEVQKWNESEKEVQKILTMDASCADAWYMNALLSKAKDDRSAYEFFLSKGDSSSKKYDIFTKDDIEVCYGYEVVFDVEYSSFLVPMIFVTTIDGTTYEIRNRKRIGLLDGKHTISCFVKTDEGKGMTKNVNKVIDIFEPCNITLRMSSFTATVKFIIG